MCEIFLELDIRKTTNVPEGHMGGLMDDSFPYPKQSSLRENYYFIPVLLHKFISYISISEINPLSQI